MKKFGLSVYERFEYLFVGLFVTAVLGLSFLIVRDMIEVPMNGFTDTDTYMRALRIKGLFEHFTWSEVLFTQSNYPFGEVLHWTRPMDLIWMAIAYPFTMFYDLKDALLYSGYILSPLMHILSCLVIVWALKPYVNSKLRFLAVILFLWQISLISIYSFSRPDHHSLLELLSLLIIAGGLRFFSDNKQKWLLLSGIFSGIMILVAAEGLLFVYVLLFALSLLWIWNKVSLPVLKIFTGSLFVTVILAWLLDPPYQGYLFPDNGRLSILTVWITGLTFAAFRGLEFLEIKGLLKTKTNRLIYIALLSSLAFLLTVRVFGTDVVFMPPIVPELQIIWLYRVTEMYGISWGTLRFWANGYLDLVALVIMGCLFLFGMFSKKWINCFVFMAVPLVIYTVLTFARIRFAPYSNTFAVFVIVFVLHLWLDRANLYARIKNKIGGLSAFFKRVISIVLFALLFAYSVFLIVVIWKDGSDAVTYNERKEILYLVLSQGDGAVVSDTFRGPEIMWKSGRPVVGTPYHRNVEGIRDNHDILFATDDNVLKQLLIKHSVKEILFTTSFDPNYYSFADFAKDRFYYRVLTGKRIPCWLEKDKWFKIKDGYGLIHVRDDKFDCLM